MALLPPETLAVVLDRTPGQDRGVSRYRLLQLVLERSGRSFALGLSQQIQSQDEAIAALEQGEHLLTQSLRDQRWCVWGRLNSTVACR